MTDERRELKEWLDNKLEVQDERFLAELERGNRVDAEFERGVAQGYKMVKRQLEED